MNREFLLDVNVLVAMAWPKHRGHDRVQSWFARHADAWWATCPFTQAGFVRILSNPAFSPTALTPGHALELLKTNLDHPKHRFWEEDIGFAAAVEPFAGKIVGHRQVSDAYLLGLVIHRNAALATLDQSIVALLPYKSAERQRIVVI